MRPAQGVGRHVPFDLGGCYPPGILRGEPCGCPSWVFLCVHVLPLGVVDHYCEVSLSFLQRRGLLWLGPWSCRSSQCRHVVCGRRVAAASLFRRGHSGVRIRLPGGVPPRPYLGGSHPAHLSCPLVAVSRILVAVGRRASFGECTALGRCGRWWLIHHSLVVADVVSRDSRCCSCRLVGYGRVSS